MCLSVKTTGLSWEPRDGSILSSTKARRGMTAGTPGQRQSSFLLQVPWLQGLFHATSYGDQPPALGRWSCWNIRNLGPPTTSEHRYSVEYLLAPWPCLPANNLWISFFFFSVSLSAPNPLFITSTSHSCLARIFLQYYLPTAGSGSRSQMAVVTWYHGCF